MRRVFFIKVHSNLVQCWATAHRWRCCCRKQQQRLIGVMSLPCAYACWVFVTKQLIMGEQCFCVCGAGHMIYRTRTRPVFTQAQELTLDKVIQSRFYIVLLCSAWVSQIDLHITWYIVHAILDHNVVLSLLDFTYTTVCIVVRFGNYLGSTLCTYSHLMSRSKKFGE